MVVELFLAYLVIWFLVSFVTVGAVAAFLEFFYVESGDWSRVVETTAIISLAGAVSGAINTYENEKRPDDHTILYWVCLWPWHFMFSFFLASNIAFFLLFFSGPLVLFVKLIITLLFGGELGDVLTGWQSILHWMVLISYVVGVLGVIVMVLTTMSRSP